ncbi:MAG: hypothetical protein DWQ20_07885 [Actinobacteria bacterium]|nr:MAG: hypothetical protein DWQ20_07885 [Actinomycetota bacterium]
MTTPEPRSEALRVLYWREEILQVLYWIEGEGFGEDIGPKELERFLGLEEKLAVGYLDRLTSDGYLESRGDERYSLTDLGRSDGARAFADEFAELTKPSHGECGAECWCHSSVEEAVACAAERVEAAHG